MSHLNRSRVLRTATLALALFGSAAGLGACGSISSPDATSATSTTRVAPVTTAPSSAGASAPFTVCHDHEGERIVCNGCIIEANAQCPGVDLSRYALGGQAMQGADLRKANLSGARLAQVAFTGADLSGANLSGADLSQTDLTGANLSGADLSGATVEGTYWSKTVCPDNTSSDAQGGTCISAAPSPV
ncbi:MAG: pentapeptide repeat-containing protein [Actinomycetes bacterium]